MRGPDAPLRPNPAQGQPPGHNLSVTPSFFNTPIQEAVYPLRKCPTLTRYPPLASVGHLSWTPCATH